MKRLFLSLLIPIVGLPMWGQEETSNPSLSESLDFTVDGIVYTILNEQEKTCQTKAGTASIDYENRKLVITYGNSKSGEINIPATVQKPSDTDATSGNDNTYTVVAIGSYGFDKASNVTIESGGVTKICEYAFMGNQSLTSITIPEGVSVVGWSAFYDCTALTSINLPTSITNIDNYAFSYTGLTSINIPENVVSIGDNAFAYCTGLQSVTIPSTVSQLGKSVFMNCNALNSLTIQEGVTSIPSYAFSGCNSLTTLTIPASVNSIGDYGFYCSGLTDVTCLNKTIPAISSKSFNSAIYANATLKVYKTVLSNYQKSQLWGQFENIEVIEVPIAGISISPSTLNVNVGLTSQLSAVLTPVDATDDIVWSVVSASPANCIEIDDAGLVTAKQIGTGRISVTCGNQMAICDVIVSANPDESVVITPPSKDIYIGDTLTFSAVVFPTTITPSITWTSSNTSVATIDPTTGVLNALTDGGAVITATNDNVSGTIAITVNPIEATSVDIDKQNITLKVGGTQTLAATVLPENTTYKNVIWESNDPSVVVVSDGIVTAVGVGTANVRAMVGQVTANCEVTVEPIEAESITLSVNTESLKIGQSLQIGATVYPENTTDKTITWTSSNAEYAIVSAEGEVFAIAQGTTTITATCGEVSASCTITVTPIESDEVVLNYSAVTLKAGGTQQLTATIYPENTTDKKLDWETSASNVATVDNGLVTAVSVGTATITVTNGSHSASCTVIVEPILVEQVIMQESAVTVNDGEFYTLNASVLPENATDQTIEWKSLNEGIATVISGVVTGVAPGSTVITATSGNATTSCLVTVLQPATSITLNKSNLELSVGDIFDLIETVMPENTTDLVSWSSSDENVAVVNGNGIVNAIKAGRATIIATCGSQTATCEVTVADIPATDVLLDATELELIAGQSHQLTATVLPENTTFPVVIWASTDTSVATVAEDGTVVAVAAGTTTITATCGEVVGTCTVTVTEPASSDVVLNYQAYCLKATETILLEVINPTGISATDIAWSSSDANVATVSAEGLVTAVGVGEATIIATYNDYVANCLITVNPTDAETVVLNVSELTMEIEDTYQLTATVSPATTTYPSISWTSSTPEVVKVSEDGELSALSAGVATITAVCGNVYGVCVVTVLKNEPTVVEEINISENDGYYRVYTIQGVNVMVTKDKSDLNKLHPGVYIINSQKVIVR